MSNFKLKPCPFCGMDSAYIRSSGDGSCQVICPDCGARSGRVLAPKDISRESRSFRKMEFTTQVQAAKLWNTRVGAIEEAKDE